MSSFDSKNRSLFVKFLAGSVFLLWLAVGAIGGPLVGQLGSVQNNDNNSFLPAGAESTVVSRQLEDFNARSVLPLFVTIEKESGLSAADVGEAKKFALQAPELSLPGLPGKLGDYLAKPNLPMIPSKDAQGLLFVLSLDTQKVQQEVGEEKVSNLIVEGVRQDGKLPKISGSNTYVTGPAAFAADLKAAFSGIDGLLLGVTLAVVLVILIVVYRSPILPVAVLWTSVGALGLSALIIFPLAEEKLVQLSGQSQGILLILVVGAATDYCLLFVARYKEELSKNNGFVAVKEAWKRSYEPILASGLTVIAGLLCLLLSDLGNISSLGPIGALGIASAMAAALTLLPAILLLLGKFAFWPFLPQHKNSAQHRGWRRFASAVLAKPRRAWGFTALVLLLLSFFAPTLQSNGVSQAQFFTTSVESVEGNKVLQKHFPQGDPSQVQVVSSSDQAGVVERVLRSTEGVLSQGMSSQRNLDGKRVLVSASLANGSETPEAEAAIVRLRQNLKTEASTAVVGGDTASRVDSFEAASRDQRLIIPVILGVVFVILIFLLRSLVAPALVVVANLLSFAATLGVSALMFNHVFDFPGADPSTPLLAFVFLVALAVDYSIFLMVRAREESLARGTRRGIVEATAVTGGVITSAGLVLAATFSALAVLPILFLVQIAFIVAFGVLLDTFVTRSILVPGLVKDLGEKSWWPGPSYSGSHTIKPPPQSRKKSKA